MLKVSVLILILCSFQSAWAKSYVCFSDDRTVPSGVRFALEVNNLEEIEFNRYPARLQRTSPWQNYLYYTHVYSTAEGERRDLNLLIENAMTRGPDQFSAYLLGFSRSTKLNCQVRR